MTSPTTSTAARDQIIAKVRAAGFDTRAGDVGWVDGGEAVTVHVDSLGLGESRAPEWSVTVRHYWTTGAFTEDDTRCLDRIDVLHAALRTVKGGLAREWGPRQLIVSDQNVTYWLTAWTLKIPAPLNP